jgi:hypothetical protein
MVQLNFLMKIMRMVKRLKLIALLFHKNISNGNYVTKMKIN